MKTILVSSGYEPATLDGFREHWDVLDMPHPAEALAYLRTCRELPLAVAVGCVWTRRRDGTWEEQPGWPPAHVTLREIQKIDSDLPVIISTNQRDPAAIVEMIKQGALDYVIEPANRQDPQQLGQYTQEMIFALRRAVHLREITLENRRLKQEATVGPAATILGLSSAIRRVLSLVAKVAPTPATVLLTGESGTGKELTARAIHAASDRSCEPFVAVNCGALSESLLCSELFGHVRGAFTGAEKDREGLIRQAGRGTVFLDEIGAVSPAFQVMLLRVLQEREVRPVGAQREFPVQCRFLAAANQDVAALVRDGTFREDLYYRLNVFHIDVPPLRQRREDIPILAEHFLRRVAGEYGREIEGFAPAAMEQLEGYDWPGNVRQLANAVERAVILCEGSRIRPADLAGPIKETPLRRRGSEAVPAYDRAMRVFEADLIRRALEASDGNVSKAARLLEMNRTTLHYRAQQLGLRG